MITHSGNNRLLLHEKNSSGSVTDDIVRIRLEYTLCAVHGSIHIYSEYLQSAAFEERYSGMEQHIIMGVHITDRTKHVGRVQSLLTEYGCYIKTRLGLHEASKKVCSPNGLIVLELIDDAVMAEEFAGKLSALEGVEVQKMIFDHE